MRKICYSVAMSLDGFVAGPNGESDWIIMDPEIDFMTMFERFDTVIMGRRTFETALAQGQGGSMPEITSVVVSRTLASKDHPDITILGDDLESSLSRMKSRPGKDMWLFGGGTLFRSLLDFGMVDTIEVAIIPVLLGEGIPLLPSRSRRASLKLTDHKVYLKSGIAGLTYSVIK